MSTPDSLAQFFGKRCVLDEEVFTFDKGTLFFYCFDAAKEGKAARRIFEEVLGSWGPAERKFKISAKNIVMFGVKAYADDAKKPSSQVAKAVNKGLAAFGHLEEGIQTVLFYDQTTGHAFFTPDGSFYPLSKDGKAMRTKDQLKIRVAV